MKEIQVPYMVKLYERKVLGIRGIASLSEEINYKTRQN